MGGRISWLGVLVRVVAALGVVLLTYNPSGHSFYHWAMRDFADLTALKAFAGRLGHMHSRGVDIARCRRARSQRARARHSGMGAHGLRHSRS